MNSCSPIAARRIRVDAIEDISLDVRLFRLSPADGRPLPGFSPGAHIDVHLPNGAVRQYSLCSDPRDSGHYDIAVKREAAGRGGSAALHDMVERGSLLGIGTPRNNFPLADHAVRHVFVAGGIGITPFVPMVAELERRGVDWELHYCARSRERAAFYDWLVSRAPQRVRAYFSEEPLFDPAVLERTPLQDEHVYCCGPDGLMSAVRAATDAWPEAQVHFEWFANEWADSGPRLAFEVELKRDGRVLQVPPERSVLEVLREAGLTMVSSCQEGVCGVCETALLAGEADHRDRLLTEQERAENKTMMICVSRAREEGGRLVLDI